MTGRRRRGRKKVEGKRRKRGMEQANNDNGKEKQEERDEAGE